MLDTGSLDADRFFDVEVVYAKATPEQAVMRLRATNHGPDPAPLHLMPAAWFRNTWSWDTLAASEQPILHQLGDEVVAEHSTLGRHRVAARAEGAEFRWLFTDNASNPAPAGGVAAKGAARYTKDAFHRLLVDGDADAVNPAATGTKAAIDARWVGAPGKTVELMLAIVADGEVSPGELLDGAGVLIARRQAEAEEFYAPTPRPTGRPGTWRSIAEDLARRRPLGRSPIGGFPAVARQVTVIR